MELLTFNTGLFREGRRDRVPEVGERFRRWQRYLSRVTADVVFLQEVYDPIHASCFRQCVGAEYEVIWPEQGCPLPSGLWLGVRATDLDWEFVPFPPQAKFGDERRLANGALSFEHRGIHFIATHLQALRTGPSGEPQVNGEVAAFERQLEVLRELQGRSPLPTVVLGDLNVGPTLAASWFLRLQHTLGVVENAVGQTWDPTNPFVAGGEFADEPGAQIDHILTGPSVSGKFWRVTESLSDHYGIGGRLELPR